MNKTRIIRSPKDKEHPFTRISNRLICDQKLSDTEVGIMVRILANSDDWIINKEYQQKRSLLTRGTFNTAWRNLVANGYIVQTKNFKPKISYVYTIFEGTVYGNTTTTDQFPPVENTQVEIPPMVDGTLITTNKQLPDKQPDWGVEHNRNEVEVRHPPVELGPDTGPNTG